MNCSGCRNAGVGAALGRGAPQGWWGRCPYRQPFTNAAHDAAGQLVKVTDPTLGETSTTAYDLAGHHLREKVLRGGQTYQDNHLSYDILGRLIDSADDRAHLTFQYDAAGNRTKVTTHVFVAQPGDDDVETLKDSTKYYKYDAMNRQTVVDGIDSAGNISSAQGHQLTYDKNGNRLTDKFCLALGYDAAGNVKAYELRNNYGGAYKNTTSITLAKYEGYVQSVATTTSTQSQTGTATSSYDANGYLIGVDDASENTLDKAIVNDAAGRVLRVRQSGNNLYTLLVNGEILGKFGVGPDEVDPRTAGGAANFAQVAQFDFGYRPISGAYPAPGVGSYTVRQGESLRSVAQAAYGDSGQWWRIAQANGLQGEGDLRVGQTLNLPSAVAGASNSATSFKPYDPGDIVGDTSPNLPQPAAQGGGCGAMGMVIMIVVAVVATVFTAGAAAIAMSAATGTVGAALGAAGVSGIMSAGAAALTGGAVLAGTAGATALGVGELMAAAAIGGAVGSIASQGVGVAIGAQEHFSWKNVAMSAVAASVTSGMGGVVGGSGVPHAVVRAAVSNAMTQGISVATGLQDQFNWAGVAASAVGAAVGSGMTDAMGGVKTGLDGFAQKLVTGTAAGLAAGATTAALRGGRIAVQQIATDAFGNALGESIVASSQSGQGGSPVTQVDANTRIDNRQYAGSFPDVAEIASRAGEGFEVYVPLAADRSQHVLLAARDGFTLGRGGRGGDSLKVTIGGGQDDLDVLEAQVRAAQKELDSIVRAKARAADEAITARLNVDVPGSGVSPSLRGKARRA